MPVPDSKKQYLTVPDNIKVSNLDISTPWVWDQNPPGDDGGSGNLEVSQSVGQSVSQLVNQSVGQKVSQSVSQSVS